RALRFTAVPVLESALERSIALAAAMDSRGYGRVASVSVAARRVTGALVLGGLLGMCVGAYGLLDAGAPVPLGLPMLLTGAAAAVAGLALGGRRTTRTRYRPDPWALPEWLVAASGVAVAAGFLWSGATGVAGLVVSTVPLEFPPLPVVPTLAALVALAPAWLAPPPLEDGT